MVSQVSERNFKKIDERLAEYVFARFLLHIASVLEYQEMSEEKGHQLSSLGCTLFTDPVSRCRHSPNSSNQHESGPNYFDISLSMQMCLRQNRVEANDVSLAIELTKVYLYKALECSDASSDSIYCLAHVELASLHYQLEYYQTDMEYCDMTMSRSCCNPQRLQRLYESCSQNVDVINAVHGFLALCKHYLTTICPIEFMSNRTANLIFGI